MDTRGHKCLRGTKMCRSICKIEDKKVYLIFIRDSPSDELIALLLRDTFFHTLDY